MSDRMTDRQTDRQFIVRQPRNAGEVVENECLIVSSCAYFCTMSLHLDIILQFAARKRTNPRLSLICTGYPTIQPFLVAINHYHAPIVANFCIDTITIYAPYHIIFQCITMVYCTPPCHRSFVARYLDAMTTGVDSTAL